MTRSVVICMAVLLMGCTAKLVAGPGQLQSNADDAVEITVMRERTRALFPVFDLFCLELDGKQIAFMRAGDYLRFKVSPGTHFLAVRGFNLFDMMFSYANRDLAKFNAKSNESYFFETGYAVEEDEGPRFVRLLKPEDGVERLGRRFTRELR